MSIWWNNFIEKIAGLPAAAWGVLALIVALGVTLIIMGRKRAPKGVMIAISAVLLAALAAASYLALPIVTADQESGGVTTASWVYSPAFWAGIVCVVGIAALVMLLRKTRWSTKMLSAGALCVALSFILDCITLYKLPQGGAITPAAMLPVMFYAWTFGPLPGITAGVVHGLLGMIYRRLCDPPAAIFAGLYLSLCHAGLSRIVPPRQSILHRYYCGLCRPICDACTLRLGIFRFLCAGGSDPACLFPYL